MLIEMIFMKIEDNFHLKIRKYKQNVALRQKKEGYIFILTSMKQNLTQ